MARDKFYIDEIPDTHEVARFMRENTDWVQMMQKVKPRHHHGDILSFQLHDFDHTGLAACVDECIEIYGDHGWKSAKGESIAYTGFSLVYNPNHQEGLDPHSSTLGSRFNDRDQFFYESTHTHKRLKDSYFDGYGFNVPTPASMHGELGRFMSRSLRTRVRSRCSIINGFMDDSSGWHRDEPVFVNLRLNIPLRTDSTYFLQLENQQPIHLDVGHAYTWNTHVSHQVFSSMPSSIKRIHLVLGFSPWWDFIESERAWVKNRFYGEKHPFDMLIEGDVFSGIQLDTNKVLNAG
jgi:hypothetical protein